MGGLKITATVIKCTLHSIQIRSSGLSSGTSAKHADATFCYPQFYQAQQPLPSTQQCDYGWQPILALPSSLPNTAQQAHFFALPYKSTNAALDCKVQGFNRFSRTGVRAWLRQVVARIQSQATPREIRGGQSDTKTDSIRLLSACHKSSSYVPYSPS
jgi:hypothetical protein